MILSCKSLDDDRLQMGLKGLNRWGLERMWGGSYEPENRIMRDIDRLELENIKKNTINRIFIKKIVFLRKKRGNQLKTIKKHIRNGTKLKVIIFII